MQRVENTIIREIAAELYVGTDFDTAEKKGSLVKAPFLKKVSDTLKKKLQNEHVDRVYNDKHFIRKLKTVLAWKSSKEFIEIEYTVKSNKRPRNDPIIDYDSDVSSHDGTLDTSVLDSSAIMDSSGLDVSLSTRSNSCAVERMEAKIAELEARLTAAELRADKAEAEVRVWQGKSKDLFKIHHRPTRANGSGRSEMFDTRLDAIVLDAENRGVAAKHVQQVCASFVRVLGWFEDEDEGYRVPKKDWFVKVRSKQDPLLEAQRKQFMRPGRGPFMVCFDATRLHQDSTLGLGCFDRDNEYLVLALRKVEASTGEEISSAMLAMMREHDGLIENTRCLMTDRCPAQVRANKLLLEKINEIRGDGNLGFESSCIMHTVINACARSMKMLSEEAKSIHNALKMTFGGRKQDSWRKNCLKAKLKDLVGIPSEFVSDLGSRFKVGEQNGKALILRETEVDEVLRSSAKTEAHKMLRRHMDDNENWPRLRLELQIPVVIWNSILGEFHSEISKKISYGAAKNAFRKARCQINDILSARSPFQMALSIAGIKHYEEESTTPEALRLIDALWKHATQNVPSMANSIDATFIKAFKEVKAKFDKDFKLIENLPIPDDCILWWTNRRIVSAPKGYFVTFIYTLLRNQPSHS